MNTTPNQPMHQPQEESKTAAIKTLAIIGFIITIVFFVWLAVQVVRMAPAAFHSLASLAETVYNTKQPFEMQIENKVVNVDEPLTITWKKVRTAGTYTFSYHCTDGISAEARDQKGDIVTIACETPFAIANNIENFQVLFSSEKKRFSDVTVSLAFTPEKNPTAVEEKSDVVTVVNATFAETPKPTETPAAVETPKVEEKPVEAKPVVTPKPTSKPVSRPVVSTPVITTVFPVSNPNGYTDLRTQYLGIGSYNESSEVFTPTTVLDNDLRGAIRFEVKNIGTKTSGQWLYSVTLPNAGDQVYTSPLQAALKPNERAVVTVAFGDLTQKIGKDTVKVSATTAGDAHVGNNAFSWTVQIID